MFTPRLPSSYKEIVTAIAKASQMITEKDFPTDVEIASALALLQKTKIKIESIPANHVCYQALLEVTLASSLIRLYTYCGQVNEMWQTYRTMQKSLEEYYSQQRSRLNGAWPKEQFDEYKELYRQFLEVYDELDKPLKQANFDVAEYFFHNPPEFFSREGTPARINPVYCQFLLALYLRAEQTPDVLQRMRSSIFTVRTHFALYPNISDLEAFGRDNLVTMAGFINSIEKAFDTYQKINYENSHYEYEHIL